MNFFLPEWNDVIFREYDFKKDIPINKDRIYAHELFDEKIFDGLLVSKSYLEETKSRVAQMKDMGIHQFLRYRGEIIGDCGAWSYSKQRDPPYSVEETLDFYEELGIDYGVSVDHLCNTKDNEENERRRLLTLKNAEGFFNQHEERGLEFEKIGVVQGWNEETYCASTSDLLDIGYTHLGIGGLAGAKTQKILPILKAINEVAKPKKSKMHLFGVARLSAIHEFHKYGIRSFDSASPLRHAWLGPGKNYKSPYYKGYSALRLPFMDRSGSKYVKELKKSGKFSDTELTEWENHLHKLLIDYDTDSGISIDEILSEYSNFDNLLGIQSTSYSKHYAQTLIDKPWKNCSCKVCTDLGVEIIIFRGNERNKRRGFHNIFTFYKLLQRIKNEKEFEFAEYQKNNLQTPLKQIKIQHSEDNTLNHYLV